MGIKINKSIHARLQPHSRESMPMVHSHSHYQQQEEEEEEEEEPQQLKNPRKSEFEQERDNLLCRRK